VNSIGESGPGDGDHELSIRFGAVGPYRGAHPRSKISMMIIGRCSRDKDAKVPAAHHRRCCRHHWGHSAVPMR